MGLHVTSVEWMLMLILDSSYLLGDGREHVPSLPAAAQALHLSVHCIIGTSF